MSFQTIFATLLRFNRRPAGVLCRVALAGALLQGCASTGVSARAPSMMLQPGPAAQHRQLRGRLDKARVAGPVTLTAYVFTQPGSLVSVFARSTPVAADGRYSLDIRVPQALAREPLLVRASTPGTYLQVLLFPEDPTDSIMAVPAMDDQSTIVAATYGGARAAQSWPRGTDPRILTTLVSAPLATAVRQAAHPERTLAALTPGLVAAVSAWQNVLAHRALGGVPTTTAAVAALSWTRLAPGFAGETLVASALQLPAAGPVAVEADAPAAELGLPSASAAAPPTAALQLALAAQASAGAWLVYADKLPWDVRGEALVDAAAMQAHYLIELTTEAAGGPTNAVLQAAASDLTATFERLRHDASRQAPGLIDRKLAIAWQQYVVAAASQLGAAGPAAGQTAAAEGALELGRRIDALRLARRQLNSRVAPAQTAARMATGYVDLYVAGQPTGANVTAANTGRHAATTLAVLQQSVALAQH